jgi:hypothetical protein
MPFIPVVNSCYVAHNILKKKLFFKLTLARSNKLSKIICTHQKENQILLVELFTAADVACIVFLCGAEFNFSVTLG